MKTDSNEFQIRRLQESLSLGHSRGETGFERRDHQVHLRRRAAQLSQGHRLL